MVFRAVITCAVTYAGYHKCHLICSASVITRAVTYVQRRLSHTLSHASRRLSHVSSHMLSQALVPRRLPHVPSHMLVIARAVTCSVPVITRAVTCSALVITRASHMFRARYHTCCCSQFQNLLLPILIFSPRLSNYLFVP
eukprot:Rmarinus@m.14352